MNPPNKEKGVTTNANTTSNSNRNTNPTTGTSSSICKTNNTKTITNTTIISQEEFYNRLKDCKINPYYKAQKKITDCNSNGTHNNNLVSPVQVVTVTATPTKATTTTTTTTASAVAASVVTPDSIKPAIGTSKNICHSKRNTTTTTTTSYKNSTVATEEIGMDFIVFCNDNKNTKSININKSNNIDNINTNNNNNHNNHNNDNSEGRISPTDLSDVSLQTMHQQPQTPQTPKQHEQQQQLQEPQDKNDTDINQTTELESVIIAPSTDTYITTTSCINIQSTTGIQAVPATVPVVESSIATTISTAITTATTSERTGIYTPRFRHHREQNIILSFDFPSNSNTTKMDDNDNDHVQQEQQDSEEIVNFNYNLKLNDNTSAIFQWYMNTFLVYQQTTSRLYYGGFILRGHTFFVEDIIETTTTSCNTTGTSTGKNQTMIGKIISCFQAINTNEYYTRNTNTKSDNKNDTNEFTCIQAGGNAYIEIQWINRIDEVTVVSRKTASFPPILIHSYLYLRKLIFQNNKYNIDHISTYENDPIVVMNRRLQILEAASPLRFIKQWNIYQKCTDNNQVTYWKQIVHTTKKNMKKNHCTIQEQQQQQQDSIRYNPKNLLVAAQQSHNISDNTSMNVQHQEQRKEEEDNDDDDDKSILDQSITAENYEFGISFTGSCEASRFVTENNNNNNDDSSNKKGMKRKTCKSNMNYNDDGYGFQQQQEEQQQKIQNRNVSTTITGNTFVGKYRPDIVLSLKYPSNKKICKSLQIVKGIDFKWLPNSFLAYNNEVGRLYYTGFYLRNNCTSSRTPKNHSTKVTGTSTCSDDTDCTFHMEDVIEISTQYCKSQKAKIISCYQATNTKEYCRYDEDGKTLLSVQAGGYPYMEIQYVEKVDTARHITLNVVAFPPDWLQDKSLRITKILSFQNRDPDVLFSRRLKTLDSASPLRWLAKWKVFQQVDKSTSNSSTVLQEYSDDEDSINDTDRKRVRCISSTNKKAKLLPESNNSKGTEARPSKRRLYDKNPMDVLLQNHDRNQRQIRNCIVNHDSLHNDWTVATEESTISGDTIMNVQVDSIKTGMKRKANCIMNSINEDNGHQQQSQKDEVSTIPTDRIYVAKYGPGNIVLSLDYPSTKKICGKLNLVNGIDFKWLPNSFLAYNNEVGRLYYTGFYLRNSCSKSTQKNHSTTCAGSSDDTDCIFHMEDVIEISTQHCKSKIAKIISCYQATNTKEYFTYEEDGETLQSVQAGGYPYMEIQYVEKVDAARSITNKVVAFPPDWLQDKSLRIKKIRSFQTRDPDVLFNRRLKTLDAASPLRWLAKWKVFQQNDVVKSKLFTAIDEYSDDDSINETCRKEVKCIATTIRYGEAFAESRSSTRGVSRLSKRRLYDKNPISDVIQNNGSNQRLIRNCVVNPDSLHTDWIVATDGSTISDDTVMHMGEEEEESTDQSITTKYFENDISNNCEATRLLYDTIENNSNSDPCRTIPTATNNSECDNNINTKYNHDVSQKRMKRKTYSFTNYNDESDCHQQQQQTQKSEVSATSNERIFITKYRRGGIDLSLDYPSNKGICGKSKLVNGIDFKWLPNSFLAYNNEVGRLYYAGFYLRNTSTTEKNRTTCPRHDTDCTFHIEDVIEISTKHCKSQIAKIISCYQATNRKEYFTYEEDGETLLSVQAGGYPYMEIQYVEKIDDSGKICTKVAAFPPDWLQDKSLQIKKLKPFQLRNPDVLFGRRLKTLAAASPLRWLKKWNVFQHDVQPKSNAMKEYADDDSIQYTCDDSLHNICGKGVKCISTPLTQSIVEKSEQKVFDRSPNINLYQAPQVDVKLEHYFPTRINGLNLILDCPNVPSLIQTDPSVVVEWIDEPVAYNDRIGRVYYGGFSICNKHTNCKLYMGDYIEISTTYLTKARTAQIVSCYQATNPNPVGYIDKDAGGPVIVQEKDYPYMEIRYVSFPVPSLAPWSRAKALAVYPPDWLQDEGLKVKRLDGLMDQELCDNPSLLLRCRLEMLSCASRLHWDPQWEVSEILDDTNDDDSGTECSSQSDQIVPTNFEVDSRHTSVDVLQTGNTSLLVKPFIINIMNGLGWDIIHRRRLLDLCQLVSYSKDWRNVMECNRDQLTEKERGVVDACIRIRRKEFQKFAHLLKVLDMSVKPLDSLVKIFNEDQLCNTTDDTDWIEGHRKRLGYSTDISQLFRSVIADIVASNRAIGGPVFKPDIILQAPCGSGKSTCFVIASMELGGITLVIEPLCALIQSQVSELKKRGVAVESLLNRDDALRKLQLRARDRLVELGNQETISHLILFCTPEIFVHSEYHIQNLVKKRFIKLIVVDEFDIIAEATNSYRSAYIEAIPRIRWLAPTVQLFFLSATFSRKLIAEVITSHDAIDGKERCTPHLYQSRIPLPFNHVFSVRRKTSSPKPTAESIARTIGSSQCICFCLTIKNCQVLSKLLNEMGLTAAEFHANQSAAEHEDIIKCFNGYKTQVLCATKALGRGVHITCPIRFIIHSTMPTSLTDYVQETGRGGRDGEKAECILYYRDQDVVSAMSVLNINFNLLNCQGNEDDAIFKLEAVRRYAIEGKACRYNLLSKACIPNTMEFTCHNNSCDNCKQRMRIGLKDIPMKDIILKILDDKLAISDFNQFTRVSKAVLCHATDLSERQRFCILMDYEERRETSLLNYLFRMVQARGTMTTDHDRDEWRKKIGNDDVSFFLRLSDEAVNSLTPSLADGGGLSSHECRILEKDEFPKRTQIVFPHIVRYLMQYLTLSSGDKRFERKVMRIYKTDIIQGISWLYQRKDLPLPSIYPKAERKNGALSLFFSCKFPVEAASNDTITNLILHPPQKVFGKRIYRLLHAERFLEVTVGPNVSLDQLLKLEQFWKFGRFYRYLWCGKHKSPQAFVFFAERGVGITQDDELTVEEVMRKCIPEHDNPDLKISQFSKRMKLAFSTTFPGPTVNSKIIVMLPDFNIPEFEEIDGAGLISQGALELIREHCRKNGDVSTSNDLNYTGFQGRIGGYKGVWVLDPSLTGVTVQCRESQCKFKISFDTAIECLRTIEICSWNRRLPAKLNIRIIQALEYFAIHSGTIESFHDYIKNCVDDAVKEMNAICTESSELTTFLSARNKRWVEDESDLDKVDSRQLFLMGMAGIPFNEPHFAKRRTRLIEKVYGGMRDCAHYPIKRCSTLRMVPDHTLLLKEGEAFLALEGDENPVGREVIAMRSPSYFAGDVRRLRVVSLEELEERAHGGSENDNGNSLPIELQRSAHDKINFFRKITYCIILSNRGKASEAFRMSGGDYDGDMAWTCWDDDLLDCLPLVIKENNDIPEPEIKCQNDKCVWTATFKEQIMFDRHFRFHVPLLARYSESLDVAIDKYGFHDDRTILLAKAAFIQVDVPYKNPYEKLVDEMLRANPELQQTTPDWKIRKNKTIYASTSILSVLWHTLDNAIKGTNGINPSNDMSTVQIGDRLIPKQIRTMLDSCTDKKKIDDIRTDVRNEIVSYLKERKDKYATLNQEEYLQWKTEYTKSRKTHILIGDGWNHYNNEAIAAVLYEQCLIEDSRLDEQLRRSIYSNSKHTKDGKQLIQEQQQEEQQEQQQQRSDAATEFAWAIANFELRKLFAGESITLICKKEEEINLYTRK